MALLKQVEGSLVAQGDCLLLVGNLKVKLVCSGLRKSSSQGAMCLRRAHGIRALECYRNKEALAFRHSVLGCWTVGAG